MTGGCDLLISEVIVCFLECHNSIISHLTQFVKNFFSSMISGIYPARRQPVMGCPDNPASRLPSLDLSLVPLGYLERGKGAPEPILVPRPVIRCLLSLDWRSLHPVEREAGSITWFRIAYSYLLCPLKEDHNCAFSPSLSARGS